MIERTLGEVARATRGRVHGDPATVVDAVATDSRQLPAGRPLFVALPGEHTDGHRFVAAAAAAGTAAALVQAGALLPGSGHGTLPLVEVDDTWTALRDLARSVRTAVTPTAVAITGSVGKTTVKDLTAAAVGAGRRVHAATGSFNNELGVPLTLLGLDADTEVLVAEVGARHVGDIADLAPLIAPDVAVVTAVAGVHLEVFGSVDAVARAKSELVAALGPGGLAVLNVDDARVAAMAAAAPAVLRVGLESPAADVTARDVVLDRLARPTATAVTPWGEVPVTLPLAGRHHVVNALLAIAVAGHLGVDVAAAAAALSTAAVSPWRAEVDDAGGVTVLNDAYNANPTSVAAALDTLVAIERTGRSWAVLGVMAEIGPTAAEEHHAIGRLCADLDVDEVVGVGPQAAAVVEGARAGGLASDNAIGVPDARAAVALVAERLAPGDVVLVKGSRVAGLEQVASDLVATLTQREAGTS